MFAAHMRHHMHPVFLQRNTGWGELDYLTATNRSPSVEWPTMHQETDQKNSIKVPHLKSKKIIAKLKKTYEKPLKTRNK